MSRILFVHGGGADVHDTWDNKLVHSLRPELGPGYDVRYPRTIPQARVRRRAADRTE